MNRLRKIGPEMVETGKPEDGVFPDNLRLFKRIEACQFRNRPNSDERDRWFKFRIRGRRSSAWTKESDLHETLVKVLT